MPARGIEPIVFKPGDDLAALATAAVRDGADALGMAGGDGSQAAVAAVAAQHDVAFVCVPAGTRNHFALDLGVDRDDPVRSLRRLRRRRRNAASTSWNASTAAFFVNNVAMGVYGAVVQSHEYRAHKVRTVVAMLPDLLGPDAEPFDLRFTTIRAAPNVRECRARAGVQQPVRDRLAGRGRARELTSTEACWG